MNRIPLWAVLMVFLWLAAVLPGTASPRSVKLVTEPDGAEVYLLNSSKSGIGIFLGSSDQPLLLEDRYLEGRGSLDVRLEKDGYFPLEQNLKTLALQDGAVLPKDGSLRLSAKNPNRWGLSHLLVGLVPLSTLLGLYVYQSRRSKDHVTSSDPNPNTSLVSGVDPLVGAEICGFRVARAMARGGMGTLYIADSVNSSGEQAAVKVVDLTGYDDTMKQRFFRELTVASKLHHPGIVRTWDYEVLEERFLAIVMEWLPGADLGECMKQGTLTSREAVRVLRPIFEALTYIHGRHIVHRDLKPSNIFVSPEGHCKLIDFGLAREEATHGLTATGLFLGTPQYAAPEQIVSQTVHPSVDQYALGLIIYQLVTGQPAFHGTDAMQILTMQLDRTPPSAHEVNPEVPLEFSQALQKMTEKKPEARFASVAEAYAQLERSV